MVVGNLNHQAKIQFLGPDSLIKYSDDEVAFLPAAEIDKALDTALGAPVIIRRHVFTDEPDFSKDLVVGKINYAYFDDATKTYVANVDLNEIGYSKLQECQSVSIGYKTNDIEFGEQSLNGGIEFNQIHKKLVFDHLLITSSPRLFTSKVQFMNSTNRFINSMEYPQKPLYNKAAMEGSNMDKNLKNEDPVAPASEDAASAPANQDVTTSINQLNETIKAVSDKLDLIVKTLEAMNKPAEPTEDNKPVEDAPAPAPAEKVELEPMPSNYSNSKDVPKEKSFKELRDQRNKKN